MKLHVDERADALYLRLDESPIVEPEEVSSGVVLDFDSQGRVVGIGILGVKERIPLADLKSLQFSMV